MRVHGCISSRLHLQTGEVIRLSKTDPEKKVLPICSQTTDSVFQSISLYPWIKIHMVETPQVTFSIILLIKLYRLEGTKMYIQGVPEFSKSCKISGNGAICPHQSLITTNGMIYETMP